MEGLKRDCSNRDIKRRALESDLRRLSESNKTAMGEISSLKEKLTLAQQQVKEQERAQEQVQQALLLQEQSALDCEVRLLKARETWEAERAAATAELEQLRRELEVCRVKVAESEGQVGAGADVHSAEVNPTATAALSSANLSPTAAVAQDEDVLLRQEQVRRLQAEVHQLHNAIAAARSGPSAVNKPAPAGSPAALALPHPTSADRGHHHAGPPAGASATQAHLDSVLRRLEQVLS